MPAALTAVATLFFLLGLVLLVLAIVALRRRRGLLASGGILLGLLLLALGGLCVAIGVGAQGYRALTREETAATLETTPTGEQRFAVRLRLPDGTERTYDLTGDQVYVDAHILKWHPIVNLLGVHTGYALDRIGGRYASIDDELTKPRTLFPLQQARSVDLFRLARRWTLLRPLVDATYGSATYTDVRRPTRFEVRVSTTGLLLREVRPPR